MSLVSSINIAQQALSVTQSAITVVSNNIANVDNENYSKLRTNLADVVNYSNITNVMAQINSLSGVKIASIERYSNQFLQSYYWNEKSSHSYLNKYASVASNVEDLMNELENTGLSSALSDFYKAVNELTKNPADSSARANFVSCSQNVCAVFNNYYSNLNDIKENLVGNYAIAGDINNSEIKNEVDNLNTLLDQIANVNNSLIKTCASGINSNTLLDERDALITKLTAYSNLNIQIKNNGTADISIGNYNLVKSASVEGYLKAVTGTQANPAQINIVDKNDNIIYTNINSSITEGSIGAILDICGSDDTNFTISGVNDKLNTLALSFANIMNDIQTGDPKADGTTALCLSADGTKLIIAGENLFINSKTGVADANINAGNISVNSNIISNNNLVAAARLDLTNYVDPSEYENNTGNNANATLMTESRTTNYSTASYLASIVNLGGQTLERYLSTTVSDVGYNAGNINNDLTTQSAVLNGINSKIRAEKGVNLDEELSDLIKYQRSYEAAARVFSICNELLSELIKLGS